MVINDTMGGVGGENLMEIQTRIETRRVMN